MNKVDMVRALAAFEACKKRLARNESEIGNGKTQFICFAIGDRPQSFHAKNIVMQSIAPHGNYASWLQSRGFWLSFTGVQRERHRFVDVCIAELQRRIDNE